MIFLSCIYADVVRSAEYFTLRPGLSGAIYVRESSSIKSAILGKVWASRFYGKFFVEATGKEENAWLQIRSVYYGCLESEKPAIKFAWVKKEFFVPASPLEDGYIFYEPMFRFISDNININIHKIPDILGDAECGLSTYSEFAHIGVRLIGAEREWLMLAPTGPRANEPGYILADFFGMSFDEIEELQKLKRYKLLSYIYPHQLPDARSAYADYYYPKGVDVYIDAEKYPWMRTTKGDWIYWRFLEANPL